VSTLRLSGGPHPAFVGVVHLAATPGAPRAPSSPRAVDALRERAASDALALARGGVDAIIVENFGDVPFFAGAVPPESVAALALALATVRASAPGVTVGVNVLRNDARAALGLCAAAGAAFVRINVHTGAMLTDQGLIEGRAAETLRERARLCPGAWICADVHVKHAVPLGGERIEDAAADARERGLADVLIVSGARTGAPPAPERIAAVRERVPGCPVWIGSGLDERNARELLALADGAIVGSALEAGGRTGAPVEEARVARMRLLFDAVGARQWPSSSSPP
jgi:membrane complex biogenesis BtpA family protein